MPDVLELGVFDRESAPADWEAWLRPWHAEAMPLERGFRGEVDGQWIAPSAKSGTGVSDLQSRLAQLGFLPEAPPDGIFGYRTQSAARLFQEYVRSVEGHADIGVPDGVVGPATLIHLDRWEATGLQPYWRATATDPTVEYLAWLAELERFKAATVAQPMSRTLELAQAYPASCDTCKVADWRFDAGTTQLVGVRRKEWTRTQRRANDDLFVLLANGAAFKFLGSTDPCPRMADRPDEPFIVCGQHRYRFGWHKQSDPRRVYRALRPAGAGVLICRDFDRDDALTDDDLAGGLEANPTINVHWSGAGTTNWSAGCQVIAGRRYIDGEGRNVDCGAFAARGYVDLDGNTRGAYNVLIDLLTVSATKPWPHNGSVVDFFLIHERDLEFDIAPTLESLLAQ